MEMCISQLFKHIFKRESYYLYIIRTFLINMYYKFCPNKIFLLLEMVIIYSKINENEERTLEIVYSVNWMSIARFDFPLCIGDKNKCSNFLSKVFPRNTCRIRLDNYAM